MADYAEANRECLLSTQVVYSRWAYFPHSGLPDLVPREIIFWSYDNFKFFTDQAGKKTGPSSCSLFAFLRTRPYLVHINAKLYQGLFQGQ